MGFVPVIAGVSFEIPDSQDAVEQGMRQAILEAARASVRERLGKAPLFKVERLARRRDWAFVQATMEGPGGAAFDYAGTPLADAAARGLVSRVFVALLRHDASGWHIMAQAVGPTDLAWEDWPRRFGAPASLFVLR